MTITVEPTQPGTPSASITAGAGRTTPTVGGVWKPPGPGPHGTPILDDFNRANGPLTEGDWHLGDPVAPGRIVSNTLQTMAMPVGYGNSLRSAPLNAPCDVFATLRGRGGTGYSIELDLFNGIDGMTIWEGYVLAVEFNGAPGVDHIGLYIAPNYDVPVGVTDWFGVAVAPLAVGDKLGLSFDGATVTGWLKRGAAAWTVALSGTDASYPGPLNPGFWIGMDLATHTSPILDDFGGGSYIA